MSYALFLDDERHPPHNGKDWCTARSVEEAIHLIEELGVPETISFDHDLGSFKGQPMASGMDFAKWLVQHDMDHNILGDQFQFTVHSMNPVGAANIRSYMDSYLRTKFENQR